MQVTRTRQSGSVSRGSRKFIQGLPSWAKAQVKGDFGLYVLVKLPSGKWASVWHGCFKIDDLLHAILNEDSQWFEKQLGFIAPRALDSKAEAIGYIVQMYESAIARTTTDLSYLHGNLTRAKKALKRALS